MNINIRKLENSEHDYLAYLTSFNNKGTYFVYFQDNIFGMIALNNFVEMARWYFKPDRVELKLIDKAVSFKSAALLDFLSQCREKYSDSER